MKRSDMPEKALVTYKNSNDARAHAFVKFLKYLYDTEQFELAEQLQEFVRESKRELYGED